MDRFLIRPLPEDLAEIKPWLLEHSITLMYECVHCWDFYIHKARNDSGRCQRCGPRAVAFSMCSECCTVTETSLLINFRCASCASK